MHAIIIEVDNNKNTTTTNLFIHFSNSIDIPTDIRSQGSPHSLIVAYVAGMHTLYLQQQHQQVNTAVPV